MKDFSSSRVANLGPPPRSEAKRSEAKRSEAKRSEAKSRECVCKRDSQNRIDRLILIEKQIRHQTKKLACAFSSSSSCVCGEGFSSSSCVRDLRRASFTFLPLKWTVIAGCRRSACPGRPPAGPALRQCRDCFLAAGMLRGLAVN